VDPRAGLGDLEERKFLIFRDSQLRPLSRPARSRYCLEMPKLARNYLRSAFQMETRKQTCRVKRKRGHLRPAARQTVPDITLMATSLKLSYDYI
jgi:hypothetical protein